MYRRPVKTKNSLFFPHMLRKKSGNWGEWWPKNNPKWSSYHPIWSISCKAVKIFVYSKYVWEKKVVFLLLWNISLSCLKILTIKQIMRRKSNQHENEKMG